MSAVKPAGMTERTWQAILEAAMRFPRRTFKPEGAEFVGISPSDQAWFKVTGTRRYEVETEGDGLFAGVPEVREEEDWFYVTLPSVHAIRESAVAI